MNWENCINKTTFYWLSLIITLLFAFYYYWHTVRINRDFYWYIYKNGDKVFDWKGFAKKICLQLLLIFFTFFTFFNVIYFCIKGVWIDGTTFQSTRVFVISGAVAFVWDLIGKSTDIIYEHKHEKNLTNKSEPPKKDQTTGNT